jgi:hypothetical protein
MVCHPVIWQLKADHVFTLRLIPMPLASPTESLGAVVSITSHSFRISAGIHSAMIEIFVVFLSLYWDSILKSATTASPVSLSN